MSSLSSRSKTKSSSKSDSKTDSKSDKDTKSSSKSGGSSSKYSDSKYDTKSDSRSDSGRFYEPSAVPTTTKEYATKEYKSSSSSSAYKDDKYGGSKYASDTRSDVGPTTSTSSTSRAAGGSGAVAAKRLVKELSTWEKESANELGVERLGPVEEGELLEWEAVINGRGIGYGYDEGRWLITISVPPTYPQKPPTMAFATPIVHPNIELRTGEICLDLLKTAWTPAYTLLECVRAVRMLIRYPEVDSPLNVDQAALIRGGDRLAARRLVEFWCRDQPGARYEGR